MRERATADMASLIPLERRPTQRKAGSETVRIAAKRVNELGLAVLTRLGAPRGAAQVQVQQLVESDLRGRPSHGMQRLFTLAERIQNGVLDPAAEPLVQADGPACVTVDGRSGFGPVAGMAAVQAALARARNVGVSIAGIRSAGHLGMLAPYVEAVAYRGAVAIAIATSEALVHPAGGRIALLGTNPIAIAVPAVPDPFVLDMSTAAISAGEVIACAERNESIPGGRAIDRAGVSTTDPRAALTGALSPFGGAKGYGLGLAIELLVAAITGCELGARVHGTLDSDKASTKGDVLLAIAPERLRVRDMAVRISEFLDEIRDSPTMPGVDRVLIPGDRMRAERTRSVRAGIAYPKSLWTRLIKLEESERAG
jgi:L-2-hydroxycarboxylate dehydrogenase (NAD+)